MRIVSCTDLNSERQMRSKGTKKALRCSLELCFLQACRQLFQLMFASLLLYASGRNGASLGRWELVVWEAPGQHPNSDAKQTQQRNESM